MAKDVEGRQVRAARGLLDWSQGVLAAKAGISMITVKRIEDDASSVAASSMSAVVRALEAEGIAFHNSGSVDEPMAIGVILTLRRGARPKGLA